MQHLANLDVPAAALCERRRADFVTGTALCETRRAEFVTGTALFVNLDVQIS